MSDVFTYKEAAEDREALNLPGDNVPFDDCNYLIAIRYAYDAPSWQTSKEAYNWNADDEMED